MICRSGIFSKKTGMSGADFHEHWLKVHGEIAARLPGLHSYRQNHIKTRFFERTPFPGHVIDGISQLKFDNVAAMEVAERSSVYNQAKQDIPKFQGTITILVLAEDGSAGDSEISVAKLLVLSTLRDVEEATYARNERAKNFLVSGPYAPSRVALNRVIDRSHPVSAGVPQGNLPLAWVDEFWFNRHDTLNRWITLDTIRNSMFADPLLQPLAIYEVEEIKLV